MNWKDKKIKLFVNKFAFKHRALYKAAKVIHAFWNPYKVEIPTGYCPVQVDGFLPSGEWYYFRSRWERWSLSIAKSEQHWSEGDLIFYHEDYFQDSLIGGWIGPVKAYILLNKAMKLYHKSNKVKHG